MAGADPVSPAAKRSSAQTIESFQTFGLLIRKTIHIASGGMGTGF
jgi:hypothetical protein